MLLVVFYHSIAQWTPNGWFVPPETDSYVLGVLASWLNSFHVYGFVLVSGYLYGFLKFEKGRYETLSSLVISKAKRLLIPYVFAAAVWVVPWDWFYFQTPASELMSRYLLGWGPSQLWFLLMLFFVFLIAYFLTDVIKRRPLFAAALALVIYGLGIAGALVIKNYFQIFTACTYFIFFAVGMFLRRYDMTRLNQIPIVVYIALDILLFTINMMFAESDSIVIKVLNLGIGLMLHLVGALMAFVILSRIGRWLAQRTGGNYKNGRGYRFLDQHSFSIYLFHQQVIYGVITWMGKSFPPIILAIANFAFAVGVSSIIAEILGKWRITRFLIGQKQ